MVHLKGHSLVGCKESLWQTLVQMQISYWLKVLSKIYGNHFVHFFCLKASINKMFVFRLVFMLYHLKLYCRVILDFVEKVFCQLLCLWNIFTGLMLMLSFFSSNYVEKECLFKVPMQLWFRKSSIICCFFCLNK